MPRDRILSVQGLRGLFAIGIVFFHLHPAFGTRDIFPYGLDLGVTFFFVLSGYLSSVSDTSDIKSYYKRKILKIWPVHVVAFVLMLIAYVPIKSFWTVDVAWKALLNIFLLQAYCPIADVYLSFNQPSWFLSAIMLFYILLPFFKRIRSYSEGIFIIIVSVSFVISFAIRRYTYGVGYSIEMWGGYFFPLTRLSDCLLGMLMSDFHDIKNEKNKNLIELVVLVSCLLLPLAKESLQPPFCHYAFLLAAMMITYIFVSTKQGFVSRLLSNGVLLRIGGLSMEIYMFHMIAIRFVPSIEFLICKTTPFLEGCMVFLMTFVMSLTYKRLIGDKIKFIAINNK